jgi:hypothetical protein
MLSGLGKGSVVLEWEVRFGFTSTVSIRLFCPLKQGLQHVIIIEKKSHLQP